LPDLPPFRQQADYTAYVEGWGLYAERLGKDVGLYKDPLSDSGRLSEESLRANRLVLDTGVHYKHWTRQQMLDFFHAHSTEDEAKIASEVDWYVSIPAQALSYKVGELKILALRERAEAALGDRFDIKAFHDRIIGDGACRSMSSKRASTPGSTKHGASHLPLAERHPSAGQCVRILASVTGTAPWCPI